jgi:RimJ/RimL family protein N-acetyltransferase
MRWPLRIPDELSDGTVSLQLYDSQSAAELFAALDDPSVWEHIPHDIPTTASELDERIRSSLIDGKRVTFTVALHGQVVGMTSVLFEPNDPEGVEIGGTQLARSAWGTGTNGQAKRLLIGAIAEQGARWIQFRTDERNARSANAILKLGATDLGLRQDHRTRRDGTVRTSRMFRLILPAP